MNLSCLVESFVSPASPRIEQYAGAVGVSFIAAVFLAPVVLYFYRWRVLRLMLGAPSAANTAMDPPRPAPANVSRTGKEFPGIEALKSASRERATQLARSLRIVALVFAVVTVAIALALRWQTASGTPGPAPEVNLVNIISWSLVALLWTLIALGIAWPVVILGTGNPRFVRSFFLITLPCLVLLMAMPLINTNLAGPQLSGYLALLTVVAGMCISLVPRHMRNVVPTLTLSLSLAVIAWMEGNNVSRTGATCLGWLPIHNREEALRIGAIYALLILAVIVGGFMGVYRMLRGVASAYRNKLFSDAQLQLFLWYVAVAVPIAGTVYASQIGPGAPPLAIIIAVSVVPTAIVYAWLIRRLPIPHRPPVILLLLRVFGRSRGGERLLDSLAASWRFIGPVCMIGGPDLAKASLEPHELAAFLSGRLKRSFVADVASLDNALTQLDLEPDPDTRYRVNELYCAGEIWTHAVGRLIGLSDVVLIDLREFHAGRLGTATELAMLAHLSALSRTIAVTGKGTDLNAVRDATAMPQSSTNVVAAMRTVSIEHKLDSDDFFANVVAAAQPSRY